MVANLPTGGALRLAKVNSVFTFFDLWHYSKVCAFVTPACRQTGLWFNFFFGFWISRDLSLRNKLIRFQSQKFCVVVIKNEVIKKFGRQFEFSIFVAFFADIIFDLF